MLENHTEQGNKAVVTGPKAKDYYKDDPGYPGDRGRATLWTQVAGKMLPIRRSLDHDRENHITWGGLTPMPSENFLSVVRSFGDL
jgi:hypothetical protein